MKSFIPRFIDCTMHPISENMNLKNKVEPKTTRALITNFVIMSNINQQKYQTHSNSKKTIASIVKCTKICADIHIQPSHLICYYQSMMKTIWMVKNKGQYAKYDYRYSNDKECNIDLICCFCYVGFVE